MKGRKPDETSVRVESFLWQWRWDLAVPKAGLNGVLRSCGRAAHSNFWPPVRPVKLAGWLWAQSSLAFGVLFLIQI